MNCPKSGQRFGTWKFGGHIPLKPALPIQQYLDENMPVSVSGAGPVCIWGTLPDSIDAAEDRKRFNFILGDLKIEQPKRILQEVKLMLLIVADIGYPIVIRPSYDLGGRAMEIVYNDENLVTYLENSVKVDPVQPVLIGDMVANGQINLMVITSSSGYLDQIDGRALRRMALAYRIPIITTVAGALVTTEAIKSFNSSLVKMYGLQDFFQDKAKSNASKILQSVP